VDHAADAPILVLSPHLDDAILSAWTVVGGAQEVVVVNVFAGVPGPGPVPRWDAVAGARDRSAHVRARLEEDRAALALAGRSAVYLDLLDRHYRTDELDAAQVSTAVGAVLPTAASAVWAPAGIGLHEDHLLVRAVAFDLHERIGVPLTLYAELPYAARFGWPGWVDGAPADRGVSVDADWGLALDSAPVAREALTPDVRRLDGVNVFVRRQSDRWPTRHAAGHVLFVDLARHTADVE